MKGQQAGSKRGAVLIFIGGLSALLGYALTPQDVSLADTQPLHLYLPIFFMMVGAGLIVLGFSRSQ